MANQVLYLNTLPYNEILNRMRKASNLISKLGIKKETKEQLFELLDIEPDNISEQLVWDWKDIENSCENLVPPNSSVGDVIKFKETLERLSNESISE